MSNKKSLRMPRVSIYLPENEVWGIKVAYAQTHGWENAFYSIQPIVLQLIFVFIPVDLFTENIGEQPFQCTICNKSCSRPQALAEHVQRHRETFTLKCVRCYRAFSNRIELAKHQQICRKRRYECHLCGFTKYGLSFNKFKRHMVCICVVLYSDWLNSIHWDDSVYSTRQFIRAYRS